MNSRRVVPPLVAFLNILSCLAGPVRGAQTEVKGTVTNITGAGVSGASVMFTSKGQRLTLKTARNGVYIGRLQPGTYDVRVMATGFCEMPRGSFIADDNPVIEINFRLIVCPSDWTGKYYNAQLNPAPDSGLRPLVIFGQAKSVDNLTRYTGPVVPDIVLEKSRDTYGKYPQAVLKQHTYPVILSYNLMTIRCNELLYDSRKHLAIGTGEVEVEEGDRKRRGEKITVVLNGLEPRSEVTP
jgi:Carboxypeptidase regulatory-like domain